MGKKRKGDNVNGWVIVDKPVGIGSTTVVSIVKRLFNAQKAGHAGTLDPAASGVLPVALGEATKTIPYVADGAKTYRFAVRWGASTTTEAKALYFGRKTYMPALDSDGPIPYTKFFSERIHPFLRK